MASKPSSPAGSTPGTGGTDAWNRRDIEAVLAHFAPGVRFTSPLAAQITGNATVTGRDAIRSYWQAALGRSTKLVFTLDHYLWDMERRELAIVYACDADGARSRVCELLAFDAQGRVARGEVMRGAGLLDPLTPNPRNPIVSS